MAHKRLGVLIAVLFAVLSVSGLEGWLSAQDESSSLNLTVSVAYAGDPDDFQQGSPPDSTETAPNPNPPAGDEGGEEGRDSLLENVIAFLGSILRF